MTATDQQDTTTAPVEQVPNPPPPTRSRRRLLALTVGVLAVVLATGGTLGYRAWDTRRQINAAVLAASSTAEQITDAQSDLAEATAIALGLHASTDEQVTDAQTRVDLAEALEAAQDAAMLVTPAASTDMALAEALAAQERTGAVLAEVRTAASDLQAASQSVQDSHEAWLLDQATQMNAQATAALAEIIATGEELLAATEGQVDDNTVRQALRDTLDAATPIRDSSPEGTVEAMNVHAEDATAHHGGIDSAMNEVTAAVQARAERIAAEQQAAAEAAARAAATQKKTTNGGSGSSGSKSSSSNKKSTSGGSGSTAPRNNGGGGGGSAPQPNTGGGGGGGGTPSGSGWANPNLIGGGTCDYACYG